MNRIDPNPAKAWRRARRPEHDLAPEMAPFEVRHGPPPSLEPFHRGAPKALQQSLLKCSDAFNFEVIRLVESVELPLNIILLSIRDCISLDRTDVNIFADLGGSVVEHGLEIKSTSPAIADINQGRTCRHQVIVTQNIDIPALGAKVRDINLDDRHPCIIGELDPAIQRRSRRSGRGL